MSINSTGTEHLAFLDTVVLFTLLGCRTSLTSIYRAAEGHRLVLHQIHYNEAARRLREAVYQLINTGKDGDKCLTSLAEKVLQKLKIPSQTRSLRDLGRLRIRIQQEAQRLLRSLLRETGIDILDDGLESGHVVQCTSISNLSYEDIFLVKLAIECHKILSADDNLVNCCLESTNNPTKCVNPLKGQAS